MIFKSKQKKSLYSLDAAGAKASPGYGKYESLEVFYDLAIYTRCSILVLGDNYFSASALEIH